MNSYRDNDPRLSLSRCLRLTISTIVLLVALVHNLQGEELPQQERTIAQWREQIKSEPLDYPLDSKYHELLKGAAYMTQSKTRRMRRVEQKVTDDWLQAIRIYRDFMEQRGLALITKWRKGESLSAEENKYRYILAAEHMYRSLREFKKDRWYNKTAKAELDDAHRFTRKVVERGNELMRKGYLQGRFTAQEIEELRLYRIYLHIPANIAPIYMPFLLGLTKEKMEPGDRASEFHLPRLETILSRKTYQNKVPFHFLDAFSPTGLEYLFVFFDGYTANEDRTSLRTKKDFIKIHPGEEKGFVRLIDFVGKKPVVLIATAPTDTFSDFRMPDFEHLRQAYKGQVEFFSVASTIDDPYCGSKLPVFWDPHSDANNPKNAMTHQWGHPLTLEDRAYFAKSWFMNYPEISIPYLLDDMARTFENNYTAQAGFCFAHIIDIDGTLATGFWFRNPLGIKFGHVKPYSKTKHPRGRFQAQDNFLESYLKALSDNKWKYDEKIFREKFPPPVLQNKFAMAAKVADVNAKEKTVTIEDENVYGTVILKVLSDSRMMKRTGLQAGQPDLNTFALEELKVGDKVDVFWREEGSDKKLNFIGIGMPGYGTGRIWCWGELTDIDKTNKTFSVQMPALDAKDYPGYQFWKTEKNAHPFGRMMDILPIVKKRIEGNDKDRYYTFAIDRGIDFYINGRDSSYDQLQLGDFIAVEYVVLQEDWKKKLPDVVRVIR